jgi:hypothetical protein
MHKHLYVVDKLLKQLPAEHLRHHPEERNALGLFAFFFSPTKSRTSYVIEWARYLLARGADVNARDTQGECTPVQNWCRRSISTSAQGVMSLLEAGADLDATHPNGHTVLYFLCKHKRLQVLRELSNAGWLQNADLEVPAYKGRTPMQQLKHQLAKQPTDTDVIEMIELLATQRRTWQLSARPAVLAELTIHEQLVPELAELIVSFLDQASDASVID